MTDREATDPLDDESGIDYLIIVRGHLEEHWSDWLGGLAISQDPGGQTLLTGNLPDQAALHGILAQIRDLGLTLISLTSGKIEAEAFQSGRCGVVAKSESHAKHEPDWR